MLDDLLDYQQTQTDAFTVLIRCALELSKTFKKFWQVFMCNSSTSVLNVDDQLPLLCVVRRFHENLAFVCEFYCVLYQIDHHLQKPSFVT